MSENVLEAEAGAAVTEAAAGHALRPVRPAGHALDGRQCVIP
jgi:hypothetical protein